MPKFKHGRHAVNLTAALRDSIKMLSHLEGVSRVVVGYIHSGRGKLREDGYIQIQRIDDHTIHALGFGDRRIFEFHITVTGSIQSVRDAIQQQWPDRDSTRTHSHSRPFSRKKSARPNLAKRKTIREAAQEIANYQEASGATLADLWPKRIPGR